MTKQEEIIATINETTIVENINCKKCDNTLPPHTIKEHMDISNSIHNCPHKMTKTKEEIIATIKKEIPFVDIKPFSHNIISLELRLLEEVAGEEVVVDLINSTKLKDLGW